MMKNSQIKNRNKFLIYSLLSILVIGIVDYYTGSEIAFSIFYLIPVLFLALQKNIKKYHIILIALLASTLWFVAEFSTKKFSNDLIPVWNAFVRLVIFLVVGILAYNLNLKHQKLIDTNRHLKKLNQEMNKLIGITAHDLRNPIGNISAFSDLLINSYSDKIHPNALKIIHYIKGISNSTLDMLEKLLDISKIESGTINLSVKRQDYQEFLKYHIALNQMLADKKQIKINFKPAKHEIIFSFDEHYLSEVINNLLTNAIKYSYVNSEINVNVSVIKNNVKTEVKDNGQGIPKDEHEKLFQYFQKTSVKPTAGEKSTGLGLAIAKKIVAEHKGTLGVESEPGRGSKFYFELPMKNKN